MSVGALSGTILYWSYARTLRERIASQLLESPASGAFAPPTFLISGNALGVGLGALMALQLLLTTNWLVVRGTAPYSHNAALLGHYLPGYTVSFWGSIVGALELFAVAFAVSHVLAGIYNFVARLRMQQDIEVSMSAPTADSMHVVILGGGPAGLATAHELAANGVAVTVLERNGYVGGLCRTVHEAGYRFDLGGHRWFTKNEDLNNWFRRLMEGELVMVERISRIYYDGQVLHVSGGDRRRREECGPVTIVKAGFAFLWAALRYAVLNRPIRNMKDAYTAQFGSTLYEMFFRRYTEKVWGKPCEELSADWVSQRSKGLSIWTVVREALSRRGRARFKA